MSIAKERIEQTNPPISPKNSLPTMYDLKSEDPEDPGLPDQYHIFQPRLLEDTFRLTTYPQEKIFVATDLNLYYDLRQTNWYKRPDWFAVVGVDRLYEKEELRMSYVIWQEGVAPFVVIELLSPGTEKEDLGETTRESNKPPTKWEVYEEILRVPYYIVFDRYIDRLRVFQLTESKYKELNLSEPKIWLEEIEIGLGLWQGNYQGIERKWLRWYDVQGNWILTEVERERQEKERERQEKERERQEKERERQEKQLVQQRAERLAERLREMGINPDDV